RSGDQYYVFAISQRAKKWFVLKSTPFELVTLAEGMDEDIHNEDEGDILRVDAQGSNFSFSINDKLVSQVTDSDYADGEVGFYVQTFDVTNAHIHFDELDIQTFEAQLICDVKALTMNVREGPGTSYSSSIFLSRGDSVEPLGRSEDGDWLLIGLDGNEQGWIINSEGYLSCSASVDILPVTPP
ncbi:MAG TPA: SH3 domain-containing protein, partial [Anaerolineales bacterium]|nr:SH3 domain-containing protein [Anaerolineales bacterium]